MNRKVYWLQGVTIVWMVAECVVAAIQRHRDARQERCPGNSYPERKKNYDALYQEREQREQTVGITAFDKKVAELFKTGFDQDSEFIRQNDQAIEEMRRLRRPKKIRLAMGLVILTLISAFSLLTFVSAIHET